MGYGCPKHSRKECPWLGFAAFIGTQRGSGFLSLCVSRMPFCGLPIQTTVSLVWISRSFPVIQMVKSLCPKGRDVLHFSHDKAQEQASDEDRPSKRQEHCCSVHNGWRFRHEGVGTQEVPRVRYSAWLRSSSLKRDRDTRKGVPSFGKIGHMPYVRNIMKYRYISDT